MSSGDRIMRIIMSVVLILAMIILSREAATLQSQQVWMASSVVSDRTEKWRVVLDSGHGGNDPGKIGISGCYEKDINLKITEKIKVFLEMGNVEVVLTRDGDYGLYQEGNSNKKAADMRKRTELIEESMADAVVSIHQNSYTDKAVTGAQVFYYANSSEGSEMAKCIQESLVSVLDKKNHTKEKANKDYYLLKNISCPGVIVECGFLSNEEECRMLESDYYQEKVAWAVYMGIMRYLNAK